MKVNRFVSFCTLVLAAAVGCDSPPETSETAPPVAQPSARTLPRPYEAISLLGDTLYASDLPTAQPASDSAQSTAARAYEQAPTLQNTIDYGKALAQRAQYQDAIRLFTAGLQEFPNAPELYRYRGEQLIVTRQFDRAVQDLVKGAELLQNRPVSVASEVPASPRELSPALRFEVYYHLGLGYYLQGQYGEAAQAYEQSLSAALSDDDRVAAADWLYMTYRRLGEDEVAEKTLAAIDEEMNLQHQEGYFERLLMYKGLVDPDSLLRLDTPSDERDREAMLATYGYGVSNFYQTEGDSLLSQQIKEKVVSGKYWAALGYIAAEADLARERK